MVTATQASGRPCRSRTGSALGMDNVGDLDNVRRLERMDSVSLCQDAGSFRELTHDVLSLHESIFERVARSLEVEVLFSRG